MLSKDLHFRLRTLCYLTCCSNSARSIPGKISRHCPNLGGNTHSRSWQLQIFMTSQNIRVWIWRNFRTVVWVGSASCLWSIAWSKDIIHPQSHFNKQHRVINIWSLFWTQRPRLFKEFLLEHLEPLKASWATALQRHLPEQDADRVALWARKWHSSNSPETEQNIPNTCVDPCCWEESWRTGSTSHM